MVERVVVEGMESLVFVERVVEELVRVVEELVMVE